MATAPALRANRIEAVPQLRLKKRSGHSRDAAVAENIRENEPWVATEADREILFKAMMNSPEPNARLRAAAKRYRQLVRNPL